MQTWSNMYIFIFYAYKYCGETYWNLHFFPWCSLQPKGIIPQAPHVESRRSPNAMRKAPRRWCGGYAVLFIWWEWDYCTYFIIFSYSYIFWWVLIYPHIMTFVDIRKYDRTYVCMDHPICFNICSICAIYEVFLRVKSCAFHMIIWNIHVCPHLPQRMAFFNQPFWKCLETSDGFGDLLGKILLSETSHRGAEKSEKDMQWTCRPTTNLHYLFMYVYLLGYIYIYIRCVHIYIYNIIIIHRCTYLEALWISRPHEGSFGMIAIPRCCRNAHGDGQIRPYV